ncbi:MAG: hypothetical protein IJC88_01135 [Oscillospiraceae bacterium]|nr:hypothetical protein [Oscillospiraceae bacterium]
MSKVNRSGKHETRAQDYVVNKILCVFTLAFLLILGLVSVSRMMSRATSFVGAFKAMPYLTAGFALLTVACVVWAIIAKVKGVDTSYRLITGKHLAFVFGFAALCAFLLWQVFTKGMLTFLYVMIPAVAVLYIIFYTYPRDFFAVAATSGIGALAVWMISAIRNIGMYPAVLLAAVILAIAALVLCVVFTAKAQKNGGKLFGALVFDSTALYPLLYATYALVAAAIIAAFVLGYAALYFAAFGLVAYLVIVGIYYTVRQI